MTDVNETYWPRRHEVRNIKVTPALCREAIRTEVRFLRETVMES